MSKRPPRARRIVSIRTAHAHLVAAILTVVLLVLAVASVRLDSATSDEPAYIAAGMIKLQHGRLDFFRDQPPLMNSLSATPLMVAGYRMPPIWTIGGNHWSIGRQFLYAPGHDSHRILFLARLPTIALFVALCWAVYLFVLRETGSGRWALFAFVLTGFCPNVMAHGRLATVDVPVTFFVFAASALFIRLLSSPSLALAAGAGVLSGAAVLTKTSANILAPYFLVLLLMAVRQRRDVIRFALLAAGAAAAFVWLFITIEGSAAYARASFPNLPRIAVPFAEYAENVRLITGWYRSGGGNPQFLLGDFSDKGWRHYYLVVLALKMTIPALTLIAAAAVTAVARRRTPAAEASAHAFGPGASSRALPACLLFVVLFLIAAANGELAFGFRYVMPIVPFLFAATAIALSRGPGAVAVAAAALLVWHGAENLRAYPSYLSYFNEFIGSHRNADRYVIDSNLDWGQDLRRLGIWLDERRIDEVVIHYFGGGVPERDVAARIVGGYGAGGRALPKGSWFALSRHFYRVSFSPRVSRENYDDYLRRSGARYVTTVGGSINVYRVE